MSTGGTVRRVAGDNALASLSLRDLVVVHCNDTILLTQHKDSTSERQFALRTAAGTSDTKSEPRVRGKETAEPYCARTALGQRLCRIRERIVASGAPLLGWEDVERAIAESRGRYGEVRDEANLH